MIAILISFFLAILPIFIIPVCKARSKGLVAFSAVLLNAVISGYYAVQSLSGNTFHLDLAGNQVFGMIPLEVDALSGWFILIINLAFLTGGFYGLFYMNAYRERKRNLDLHAIAFVLQHLSMLAVTVIRNSLLFLVAWELLAITSFLLIIFEREKIHTIKAGINYLIQSHFSMIFLLVAFIWVSSKTGSYDFGRITEFTSDIPASASVMLFIFFFIGFGFKAGFIPFHTWLPHAHPAAPSHVSGLMSGVIIKAGIYGILRILLLIRTDFIAVGYIVLAFAVLSGLYGVMQAIVQHNLKRLLAYHSIENIGIIGIGIGIGCIGIGNGNNLMIFLGFAGAMLHTLNHALFKSLLFYTAGNVYQAFHTMNIESLGGIIKKMPRTTVLFLVAAIAICGLPPFNGFISEFIIYLGIYNWILGEGFVPVIIAILTMAGLVLIGGLALMCFTKAFGIVFLGSERKKVQEPVKEVPHLQLIPLYILAVFIALIGLFPQVFLSVLSGPVNLYTMDAVNLTAAVPGELITVMQNLTRGMWMLILFVLMVLSVRRAAQRKSKIETGVTWGCGYVAPDARQQYTASSFVRSYRKLFEVFLLTDKRSEEVNGIFPKGGSHSTHAYDKLEKWLIDKPLKLNQGFLGKFTFLHNGRLQVYILYGIIFILSVIILPLIYGALSDVWTFFQQL